MDVVLKVFLYCVFQRQCSLSQFNHKTAYPFTLATYILIKQNLFTLHFNQTKSSKELGGKKVNGDRMRMKNIDCSKFYSIKSVP